MRSGRSILCHHRQRAAMTLMELLLALALCGLLLAATGTSLHLFGQIRNRSQSQISEKHIVRALLELVSRDLRPVTRPVWSMQRPGAQPRAESERFLNLHRSELLIDDTRVEPVELAGTSHWISIHTEQRPAENLPDDGSPTRNHYTAEGLHVVWWNGHPLTVPVAANGFRSLDRRVRTIDKQQGPTRVAFVVASGAQRSILEAEPLVEGYELRFRYFDGVTWRDSWDSRMEEHLPAAIECRVLQDDRTVGRNVIAFSGPWRTPSVAAGMQQ